MDYYCVLCKQAVKRGDPGILKLDPCALVIIPHIDQEEAEPDQQVFYCHFECFRRIVNDDAALQIVDADHPASETAEGDTVEPAAAAGLMAGKLAQLTSVLEEFGAVRGIWDKLLAHPRGRWVELADLVQPEDEIYQAIRTLDPFIKPREDILITWVDDYYNATRPFINNRLVLLTLDSGYDWMGKILINLDKPDKSNFGFIP